MLLNSSREFNLKKGLAQQSDTFLQAPNGSQLAVTANLITVQNNKRDIGGAVIGWQKNVEDYMKICSVGHNTGLQGFYFHWRCFSISCHDE